VWPWSCTGSTPPLLLALTFANGIGLAMRWPVFAAIVPELVPRRSVAIGAGAQWRGHECLAHHRPVGAGALIASAGSEYVFGLNALLSVGAGFCHHALAARTHREPAGPRTTQQRHPRGVAVCAAVQPHARGAGAHFAVFLHSTALLALLPLVARGLEGGRAGTFTLLLAAMGAGAILAALSMQRIRNWMPHETLLLAGRHAAVTGTLVVAWAPNVHVAVPAMFVAGMAWISVANTLTVSAQMALPDWVRARGMSIYQMAIMGSTAAGAALWGQIATVSTIHMSWALRQRRAPWPWRRCNAGMPATTWKKT
jgi:MFS family permease